MRVNRLALEDFRGVRKLELLFPTDVTVLAGINGAGKSTVLDALATMLWRVGGLLQDKHRERRPLQANDVRNGASESLFMIETSGRLGKLDWGLRATRTLSRVSKRWQAQALTVAMSALQRELQIDPTNSIPFAVYYRTNRAVLDIPLRIRKRHSFNQFAAFDEALDGSWSSFRLFFEWFREREDFENQERARAKHFVDPQLRAVRDALAELVPGFGDLRVQRQPLRMTVQKGGAELDVGQLSDGEKCLVAMVSDLARRLALANPASPDPLMGGAIVLIDEIELHLHPQWQRMVIPSLQRTFPNCQFIVTTHSPQVLGSQKAEGVRLLTTTDKGIEALLPSASYGRDSNQILLELMGTPDRPRGVRDDLNRLFHYLDVGDLVLARSLRRDLEQRIGPGEPEFVRADILLRRREAQK